jgi:oligoendopeptidase F
MATKSEIRHLETGAESVTWDLTDLYSSVGDLEKALEQTSSTAQSFSEKYRGQVAQLAPALLAVSLEEFERLHDQLDKAYTYAFLNWCTNTIAPERGALLQRVREAYTRIGQTILFFEIELLQIQQDDFEALLAEPSVSPFRHYLETLALRRNHVLTEPEERILAEKSVTGPGAWSRFFDETLGAAIFRFREQDLSEQEILALLYESDRATRCEAALTFTEGLKSNLRVLTYIVNTVLAEKASDDRIRGYENWLASRNISNEISDAAVNALVKAVTSRFDLVARYYHLKRRLLGLDELFDYDRYAPINGIESKYEWGQARTLVLESYGRFHPLLEEIAGHFFEKRWIDARLSPGKRGGAFSHPAVPEAHPYILMNFTGNTRDVQTLAHELGHGVHQYLARKQGSLQANTPLTTSETASVFGEMLVFERLLETENDSKAQLSMLMSKIDDTIATVFRQIAMNRFENKVHTARRTEGELSSDRLSELWIESQRRMFQESVTLGDHYALWWSYIPHFIHTPGYVYAYAFGNLLVLALYSIYQSNKGNFAEKYIQLLEAGGSDWPHVLVGRLGVDLQDPKFWQHGLGEIEKLICRAENLAKACE